MKLRNLFHSAALPLLVALGAFHAAPANADPGSASPTSGARTPPLSITTTKLEVCAASSCTGEFGSLRWGNSFAVEKSGTPSVSFRLSTKAAGAASVRWEIVPESGGAAVAQGKATLASGW